MFCLGEPWCILCVVWGQHLAVVLPWHCPLTPGAPLSTTSCCKTGELQQAAHTPGGNLQPWRISHCSAELWSSWSCSSCSKVVHPAGSTFLPCPQLELCWHSSSCQLWVGEVSWECLTKLKGKVLYKKTQPPVCSYTSNHHSVVFFLLVAVLIKKHKLKNCSLAIHKTVLVLKSMLLQHNLNGVFISFKCHFAFPVFCIWAQHFLYFFF